MRKGNHDRTGEENRRSGSKNRRSEGKYLTFSLDQEEYAIGIPKVREIIGMMRVTPFGRPLSMSRE
jgi:chemotaxis signal transduction protein